MSSLHPQSVESGDDWNLLHAFISLAIALGTTVVTFVVLGSIFHWFNSRFSFSLNHAMHQTWAWVSILALSVLWLVSGLVHQIRARREPADREPATLAGETTDEGNGVFDQNHLMAGPRLTGHVPIGRSGT